MKCQKCACDITDGEERAHNHEVLCEDCYIDVLSPVKFCDPLADYTAKSFALHNPDMDISENQSKILEVLKETGGADPIVLMEKLKGQMSPEDGERDCAALHRMGKIKIENRPTGVWISLA